MQINSTWLPVLARYGIHEHDLLHPCTSLQVGAWILAGNVQRLAADNYLERSATTIVSG